MSTPTSQESIKSYTSTDKGIVGNHSGSTGKIVSEIGGYCATERSSSSESDPTPPTSPTQESPAKVMKLTNGHADPKDDRYIKLKDTYTRELTWSNNPRDLDLAGMFSKDEPNLASDFNVEGLQPILKDGDGDMFVLRDAQENYYLWDPWDGHLLKVSSEWATEDDLDDDNLEGLVGVEKIVNNILRNLSWALEDAEAVFRTYGDLEPPC